tara:strand:+ start:1250 stop:1471 length:222 start_codon:yes stop_codon:yes gene_type:complete
MERKLKLIGKKVLLKNVYSLETDNGIVNESYRDIEGILEKLGSNDFFGWDICATVNGRMYKIDNLSQILPIYN